MSVILTRLRSKEMTRQKLNLLFCLDFKLVSCLALHCIILLQQQNQFVAPYTEISLVRVLRFMSESD